MSKTHSSVLSLIGNTPLVEIKNIDTGLCRLFVKMESDNPGGSIKDRVASYIINQAEKDGKLKPGGTIIEATAGNTGIGLALVGILKGYKVLLVIPDKMSLEKIAHLKALGAEIIIDVGVNAPGAKMSKKSRKKLNEFIAEYDGFTSIKSLSKNQVEFLYEDGSSKTLDY